MASPFDPAEHPEQDEQDPRRTPFPAWELRQVEVERLLALTAAGHDDEPE